MEIKEIQKNRGKLSVLTLRIRGKKGKAAGNKQK